MDIRRAYEQGRICITQATEIGWTACACRKSNPDILVVQPADNWAAKNMSGHL
jgi:hypothetical protein